MRAARLQSLGGPVVVEEVPVPEPGPGEARVRVRACGVCGSDVHVVHGITPSGPLPLTLGHEAAGVVDVVGDTASGWSPGDRVALAAGYGCGSCPACTAGRENRCPGLTIPGIARDGAQAEYVVVPESVLVRLPEAVDFATGAILTDAVATPWGAIRRAGVEAGQTVAVFGLGGLGVHAVALLSQVVGARVVGVDVSPGALDRARSFGADDVVDASDGKPARAVRALTGGVDHSFELVGAAAVTDQAVKSLRPGGTCTVVGVTPEPLTLLPQALLVAQELRVQGSFGCTRADLESLVGLVADGRLDLAGTITHRFDLDSAPEAIRVLETKAGDPIRVVVEQPS
jgi:alcohol dehydrogenase, propanol-preferring